MLRKRGVETVNERIEITDGVVGGKARIEGRRITVQNIVIWYERMGKSADEIATEYELELSDVVAALAYYYGHRGEIDRQIEEGEAFVEAVRAKSPSRLLKKLDERKG